MLQNCWKNIHTNDSTNDEGSRGLKEGFHTRSTRIFLQKLDDHARNSI